MPCCLSCLAPFFFSFLSIFSSIVLVFISRNMNYCMNWSTNDRMIMNFPPIPVWILISFPCYNSAADVNGQRLSCGLCFSAGRTQDVGRASPGQTWGPLISFHFLPLLVTVCMYLVERLTLHSFSSSSQQQALRHLLRDNEDGIWDNTQQKWQGRKRNYEVHQHPLSFTCCVCDH